MLSRGMDLRQRVWLGVAELGMALAGFVAGYLVVGSLFETVETGPLYLMGGPLITGVAAAFYGWVGPKWAEASRPEDAEYEAVARVRSEALTAGQQGLVVVVGIGAALGGSIVLGVLLDLLGQGVQEQSSVLDIAEQLRGGGPPTEAIVLAVSALLMAPVAEELLFRRLLFVRMLATSGRVPAYLLSALAFAAIHGNPAGIVIYLWLGLVFAAVLERTGRVWVPIVVHMGNNAYVLAMLFFGPQG